MSCRLCCLVSMLVFFLSISRSMSVNNNKLIDWDTQSRINHVCQKSYDYYLCHDIFNKNIHTDAADFYGLTVIALAQTLIYASETLVFLQRSGRDEGNATRRDLYKICDEGYGSLSNQFQQGSLDLAKNNVESLLNDIGDCERFVNDCESVLGFEDSTLHDKNSHARVLVKMSNISGSLIGNDLKNK